MAASAAVTAAASAIGHRELSAELIHRPGFAVDSDYHGSTKINDRLSLSKRKEEHGEVHVAANDETNSPKEATRNVQHTCEDCGVSFRKPAYLMQHMLCHSFERPFTCPMEDCFLSYRRKDHLNRHLLKHQGKVFECPVENCDKKFTFQGNMTRHVKKLHDGDLPCKVATQHICKEPGCEKTFKYLSKLKKHETSHAKQEYLEIICGEQGCTKLFINRESLRAHIESCHKYVKCEVCETRQLKKNIKQHQRTHEHVAKPKLKCSFEGCEHTYSRKSNLKKHVKAIHEKLRPFACRTSGCHQKFHYKHVRDAHEKTHYYEQGDFLEADEQRLSRSRGGRKRQRIGIEALTRKRVVPLDRSSVLDDGANYLRWLLHDDDHSGEEPMPGAFAILT
ncbi:hypothetical protein HPP92_012820 [Vanilla planifolia]|uniref:C2H2-type domain-containing protein n=1 Tax=Vanilla planifolia TaxID=51239 RepID=A0A835QR79_VANPL|nr:hypothetical protein HPP92_013244 [Vanilla planifolia]KAG0478101.1 hypothetical protein HPP92_012820 [Vanilla planifolia]